MVVASRHAGATETSNILTVSLFSWCETFAVCVWWCGAHGVQVEVEVQTGGRFIEMELLLNHIHTPDCRRGSSQHSGVTEAAVWWVGGVQRLQFPARVRLKEVESFLLRVETWIFKSSDSQLHTSCFWRDRLWFPYMFESKKALLCFHRCVMSFSVTFTPSACCMKLCCMCFVIKLQQIFRLALFMKQNLSSTSRPAFYPSVWRLSMNDCSFLNYCAAESLAVLVCCCWTFVI